MNSGLLSLKCIMNNPHGGDCVTELEFYTVYNKSHFKQFLHHLAAVK